MRQKDKSAFELYFIIIFCLSLVTPWHPSDFSGEHGFYRYFVADRVHGEAWEGDNVNSCALSKHNQVRKPDIDTSVYTCNLDEDINFKILSTNKRSVVDRVQNQKKGDTSTWLIDTIDFDVFFK